MALSRPYVLLLLAAVLTAATVLSFQSAGQSASAQVDNAPPAVTDAPRPATTTPQDQPAQKARAKPAPKKAAPDTGVPPRVKRALDSDKTVVLFFRQPAADDAAVAGAVSGLRKSKNVAVFSDRLTHIGRYRRVVADLGISQAPAVVIVGKGGKARLVEGYVDSTTLRQQVKDSR